CCFSEQSTVLTRPQYRAKCNGQRCIAISWSVLGMVMASLLLLTTHTQLELVPADGVHCWLAAAAYWRWRRLLLLLLMLAARPQSANNNRKSKIKCTVSKQ